MVVAPVHLSKQPTNSLFRPVRLGGRKGVG